MDRTTPLETTTLFLRPLPYLQRPPQHGLSLARTCLASPSATVQEIARHTNHRPGLRTLRRRHRTRAGRRRSTSGPAQRVTLVSARPARAADRDRLVGDRGDRCCLLVGDQLLLCRLVWTRGHGSRDEEAGVLSLHLGGFSWFTMLSLFLDHSTLSLFYLLSLPSLQPFFVFPCFLRQNAFSHRRVRPVPSGHFLHDCFSLSVLSLLPHLCALFFTLSSHTLSSLQSSSLQHFPSLSLALPALLFFLSLWRSHPAHHLT